MRGLTFDTDVLALLPRDGRTVPAFRSFVEHFGSLDELYVVFTAPDGHDINDYAAEIERWVTALRAAPEIVRVDTGTFDRTRDLGWLADRQLLLLGSGALDTALRRLRGEEMGQALAARRELLALPSADIADLVRNDPLGMFDLLQDELGGAQAGVNLGVAEGGYVTADGRSRLLIARPAKPAFDAAFSRSLAGALERIRQETGPPGPDHPEGDSLPPLHVEYAGGHRIAVETEAVVKRESILNTVGSLVLILPVLFLIFRSAWLVLVGPLPSTLALIAVLGALGLAGATLSAAATASAAMLFGLGIDGVVLMYVAYGFASGEDAGEVQLSRSLAGPARSMLLGMWTTAATFYGLAFVDFPSLQQLGMLIGHSMVLCGVLTLVLVPALLPRSGAVRRRPPLRLPRFAAWTQRRRRAIRIGAGVVTVALAAAALGVRIDPTLDRLRSVTPGAVMLERLGPRFNLPSEVYLIVQRGSALEPLLLSNERLAAAVRHELPALPLHAASGMLPSMDTQAARAGQVRAANLTVPAVTARLRASAQAGGFSGGAFQPFEARLPRLLATDERLTFEGYAGHGLGDLVGRFVAREGAGWVVVSYAMPGSSGDVDRLESVVAQAAPDAVLTGLPLVNRELADRFLPQFLKGLAIGTAIVLVLIVVALREWRLALLALTPAVIGLIWAAGVLSLARVSLDLFALFAVVTFIGIGVDYGIHVVHRYRERGAAIAIEELSPVILVAGLITLLGYGTLVTSAYPPLRSIGVVSIVAVITLCAAALLVLPVLLPPHAPEHGVSPRGAALEPGRGDVAMRTAALIPAFNEAPHVAAVIEGLRGTVDHVMVVDDGSTDGTGARALASGAEVLTLPRNSGKGLALRTGLDALAARDFTHVLLLDGDLQHLPGEAPRLIDAARTSGADLILGERSFNREAMPGSRYHANRLGTRALSGFLGLPLRDTQCGFRVVRLSALRNLRLRGRGYEIETEMLVKLWRRGARIGTVSISAVYAGQVSKLRPIRDTTKTCFLAVYYRYIERI
jgi:predicted exporter